VALTVPTQTLTARSVVILVLGVGVTCALHVGKLPIAIPVLQDALGMTLLQAGFLLSLMQLAGMLLGLPVGLLADRWGASRVMLAGLLILAIASVAGALAPGVEALLATRVLEGIGFLLAVLPAPALLRQRVHEPAVLSKALGMWGAYMPIGTALALLAGVPLLGAMGWRWVWVLLGLLSLCAAAALAWGIPSAGHPRASASQTLWPRLRRTLSAQGPWLVALAFLMYSGQWIAVVGFLPTIYAEAGYVGSVVGALSALAAGINIAGNIGAGRGLARGVPPGVLLGAGFVAMGAGAVIAFAATGYPSLQYGAVLIFSGLGGLIPGTLFGMAVVLAPGEDTVSTTVGWMQQFSALGQFLGPPLVAWVAVIAGGWQSTWMVTGACSVIGLGLAWRLQAAWRSVRSP
jgi:MFS family permease